MCVSNYLFFYFGLTVSVNVLPDEISSTFLSYSPGSTSWTQEERFGYKEITEKSKEWATMMSLFESLDGTGIPVKTAYVVYVS